MTTAVVANDFGGPEVLSVVEETIGAPGADQVLISVRGVGTNPIDYELYSGGYGKDREKLPMHLGFEVAGVVTAVPGGTTGPAGPIAIGDEVIAYRIEGTAVHALAVIGADAGVEIRAAARRELVRQAEAGKLQVLVAASYPLAEVAEAHRELIGGHTHGKIVLIP